MLTIRNERPEDYAAVEELTRRAFYNVYVPGCTEHYLVHIMRGHRDFLPELDFVAELDGRLNGNIMYTRSWLTDGDGNRREILTFGPVSILPECQRKGYGKQLMEHSFARAREMGYGAVVIFGSPANYVSRGFVSCKKYRVSLEGGRYPAAMLVKELIPGTLAGNTWTYTDSPVMHFSEEEARRFDETLPPMEKRRTPSQEEFYIMSHATLL